jgi:diguanylate cyclase (GGDEF)-like protein
MRNAALLATIVVLLIAALTGFLATPFIAAASVLVALAVGRYVTMPVRTNKHGQRASDDNGGVDAVPLPRMRNPSEHTTDHKSQQVPATHTNEQDNRRELESGLRTMCDSTGAHAGILWRVDPSGDVARPVATHGRPVPQARTLRGDPLGWVAKEGTPLRMEPAPAWVDRECIVIALRLWQRENRGWLLTLEFPLDAKPEAVALDAVAAPLRMLVELQERRIETDADRRRLNSLLDILHRIPVATELEPAADVLVDACMQITGASGGAVGVWDGEVGRIVSVRGGDGGPIRNAVFQSPTSEMALSVRAGGPLIRPPGTWKPGPTQMANATDRWQVRPRTFAAIPLATSSGITAVLAVWNSSDQPLDSGGIELIGAIAPYAALHLKHAREFGRMKETAETDGLTGLRNRRAFDAAVLLETSRYDRYARPLSLLLLDLDHFKAVNDTHGHEAGDEVLRRVADIVKTCVRDVDTAARFGGEELAILLPETPLAAAREVAERIRLTIASTPVQWAQVSIRVTVSIGMAAVPESVATVAGLLTQADEALYNAKKQGRNRVISGSASKKA